MRKRMWICGRAKHSNWTEHCQMFVVGMAEIVQGLVTVLSLGFWRIELTAWLLFYVFEDDEMVLAAREKLDELKAKEGA